jgi:hypothetical protein
MLMFIAGAVAAVVVVVLVCVCLAASSSSSREPYAGTQVYYPSHLEARLGAVSYRSDWQPTRLTRSMDLETPAMRLKYTIDGSPDAVLQDRHFMNALASAMVQAAYGDIATPRNGRPLPSYGPPALSSAGSGSNSANSSGRSRPYMSY